MHVDFRSFYDDHVRFVWRALLRIGVHDNDLADAVQDVFVVVHRKLPEFEGRSKVTTWLFAICLRVASDRRNVAHLRHEVPSDDELQPGSPMEGDVDGATALDRARARRLLQAILDRMPQEQRLVFSLFELEEMAGEEIAELLDIPVGTVRSRLRLARESFRQGTARLQAREQTGTGAFLRRVEA